MTLIDDLRRETAVSAGSASALPFRAYSDPMVYQLEAEKIFQQDWFALCPAVNPRRARRLSGGTCPPASLWP